MFEGVPCRFENIKYSIVFTSSIIFLVILKKKIFLGIIAIVNKIYENLNIRLVYIFSSATEKQLGKGNKSFFLQNKNIITDPHKINRKKNMKQVWLYVGPSAAPLAFLVQDD